MSIVRQDYGSIYDPHAESLIAPIQETLVAYKDYAVGDCFILDGVMYRMTQAVLQGATIVIGTDCEVAPPVTDMINNYNLRYTDDGLTFDAKLDHDPATGYVKWGNIVIINLRVALNAATTAGETLTITGFPPYNNITTATSVYGIFSRPNYICGITPTGDLSFSPTDALTSGRSIIFSFVYLCN